MLGLLLLNFDKCRDTAQSVKSLRQRFHKVSLAALNLDCKHSLIFLSDSGASKIRSARENICKQGGKQNAKGREKRTQLFALFRYP